MRKNLFFLGLFMWLFLLFPGNTITAEAGRQVPHYDIREAGGTWTGTNYYLPDGTLVRDAFFCDGEFTYYLQADGTPMKDRLTYHPDGEHIIYFDEIGHEIFSNFTNVKMSIAGTPVDDLCFFDVYGYMYVDVLTYDKEGVNLYYANPYGVMERNGWFRFSDGRLGYANSDGKLAVNMWTKDAQGRAVYLQGNGSVATDFLYDGTYYYKLHPYDGYVEAQVTSTEVQAGTETAKAALCNLPSYSEYRKYEFAYKTGNTNDFTDADWAFYNGLKPYLDDAYQYATTYERELAIHDYMVLHNTYDHDNYLNNTIPWESYNPVGVFVNKTSVCDGYTNSFKLCMDILGIPCIRIVGVAAGEAHSWNAVQLDSEWYMVDVTWDDPDIEEHIQYNYFNVTDDYLQSLQGRTYTREIAATDTKYNYYERKYPNAYRDSDSFDVAVRNWAAQASVGDSTEMQLFCRYDKENEVDLDYADIHVSMDPIDSDVSAWATVTTFRLTKYPSYPSKEEYINLFTQWEATASPGDTVTYEIYLSHDDNYLLADFTSALAEKGMLATEQTTYIDYDYYGYYHCSVQAVKEYPSIDAFFSAITEWNATAKPGDKFTIYFPYGTAFGNSYENDYKIPLEQQNIFTYSSISVDKQCDKEIYTKAFTHADSADAIVAYAQGWLDDYNQNIQSKFILPRSHYIYIRMDDHSDKTQQFIDAVNAWADKNNIDFSSWNSWLHEHNYLFIRIMVRQ